VKYPVSLIIIARNAEKELPEMLDSVAAWISEIVAVINDCTDNTRAVLESYGARVYEHAWAGYADQKNRALSYCTHPWVLSLDADEVCTPELVEAYQKIINENDLKITGVENPRCTHFLGKWIRHGDWYPDRVLRLFRREGAYFEGGQIHERIVLPGNTIRLKADLLHYSFPSIESQLLKIPPYSTAFAKQAHERGKRFSACSAVFRALWRFVRGYFVKLGFLDGYAGFYIALYQTYFTLYRYTRLKEIADKKIDLL
jgi:glycosyltransferase involved in cell wall biosynthesis